MVNYPFHEEQQNTARKYANLIIDELPEFTKAFFKEKRSKLLSERSIYGYAVDMRGFFQYILKENPSYHSMSDIDITILEKLTYDDMIEYEAYLRGYEKNGKTISNEGAGISRKLSTLRTFFKFYNTRGLIENNNNPMLSLSSPKVSSREITQLSQQEVKALQDKIDTSNMPSHRQSKHCENSAYRDKAIITLFIGTGIRISELVGLNIEHIDFKNRILKILRKGNKEQTISFANHVATALDDYINLERDNSADTDALFLSNRKTRITVRSVERIVAKFTKDTNVTIKHVTPHKLRSTFGSYLYQECGDIYEVKEALGHEDVSTTIKHYSKFNQQKRIDAANTADHIFGSDKEE